LFINKLVFSKSVKAAWGLFHKTKIAD